MDKLRKEAETEENSGLLKEMKLSFIENSMDNIFFDQIFSPNKEYLHIKINDSLALSYNVIDEIILGDYLVNNIENDTFFWLAKSDSITKYNRRKSEPIKNNIIDLIEYKNDTKDINGFKCFKVTFKEEEILDDTFLVETFYTIYTTDKIKFKKHPVIKNKFVLDKYFPLQIEETPLGIEGAKTFYYLEKLNLYQD